MRTVYEHVNLRVVDVVTRGGTRTCRSYSLKYVGYVVKHARLVGKVNASSTGCIGIPLLR